MNVGLGRERCSKIPDLLKEVSLNSKRKSGRSTLESVKDVAKKYITVLVRRLCMQDIIENRKRGKLIHKREKVRTRYSRADIKITQRFRDGILLGVGPVVHQDRKRLESMRC